MAVKGLKMVYQQHVQYIQARGMQANPVDLFDQDLSMQILEWRKKGERVLLLMDVNGHPLQNNFYLALQEKQTDMEEFSHKCWGQTELYTQHPSGKSPIDGGYKSLELEIVNLARLNFAESPGDHRSLVFNISTWSVLGKERYKVCRPVSRRLVTLQARSVKCYNEIV